MAALQSVDRRGTASVAEIQPADPPDDMAAVLTAVRGGVLQLSTGVFAVALTAAAALLIAAAPSDLEAIIAIVVIGGLIAGLVMVLLERSLERVDRLGRLNVQLSDLYDRARLDALHDPLTGLGNHRAFQEELDRAVGLAQRHHKPTALLLIDVDDLKRVNDTDGHAAGDEMLLDTARVIVSNMRRLDRAFRIGGDEFAILSPHATTEMALAMGRRLLAVALEGGSQDGRRRPISFTVGISGVPEPSADRHLLYRHADAALYWGKRHGRTDVRVYDPAIQGVADDERPLEEIAAAVDRTIAERLLTPMFQPVFDLIDGRCLGFEGLIRPTEAASFRNAGALFVAGETVNRTVELDLASIRAILDSAGELSPDHYLAINLSPRSLEAEAFNPHEIARLIQRAGLEPTRLVVELTEREAIEDPERLARNLAVFRRLGVRIAADDVGAGNAGLRLLSRFTFDIIKVDMSLVHSGAILHPSRSVLRAIIDMADQSGATTVAEGVETPLQLETLRELGVAIGQGYLLGMPRERPVAGTIDLPSLLADREPGSLVAGATALGVA